MNEQPRKRAPAMSPEARREMIVRAALPLVAELGGGVSTQQIARAAGIGEATIFRAFDDKAALLRACMHEAVRPEHLEEALGSISTEQPLEERLVEAGETLIAHSVRVGAIVEALLMSAGMSVSRGDHRGNRSEFMASREAAMVRTNAALADLFRPEAHRLRLPVELAAHAFHHFVLSLRHSPGGWAGHGDVPTRDGIAGVVDLFLNGALGSRPEELSRYLPSLENLILATGSSATENQHQRGNGC